MKKNIKKITVAVAGGFDPIHIGHVRHFQAAKKLGNNLVVIINNDNWLMKKKGFVFMPENERKELIENMAGVNRVILTSHPKNPADMSISQEILKIKPNIYANGGNVTRALESEACGKVGCKLVFDVGRGGKIQSSSWLIENFIKQASKFKRGSQNLRKKYQRLVQVKARA